MFEQASLSHLDLQHAHLDAKEVELFRLIRAFIALESVNMHSQEARRALRARRPKHLSELFALLQERPLFRLQPIGTKAVPERSQGSKLPAFLEAALEFAAFERARRKLPSMVHAIQPLGVSASNILEADSAISREAPDFLDPLHLRLEIETKLDELSDDFESATFLTSVSPRTHEPIDHALATLRKKTAAMKQPTVSVLEISERIESGVVRGLDALGVPRRGHEELRARLVRIILELSGLGTRRQRAGEKAAEAQLESARKNRRRRKAALAKRAGGDGRQQERGS